MKYTSLQDILEDLRIDDIRFIEIKWYDNGFLKSFEYHQIKADKNKQEK